MHTRNSTISAEDIAELTRLEESLWQSDTRYDDTYMERIFDADFFEFGRSGRRYTRQELFFELMGYEDIVADLPFSSLEIRELAKGVVLVTYLSKVTHNGEIQFANRSSIWRRSGTSWKLFFHQGTPTSPPKTGT